MNSENIKNKLLEKIYLSQEEKTDEIIKEAKNELNNKLIKTNKEIILEKYNNKELNNLINKIEENNNIKISYLSKKIYEQGFIDGVNLLLECLWFL